MTICQIDNATGEVPTIISPILKTASKSNYSIWTHMLGTVSPDNLFPYANDLGMYSQLPLPIC